MDRRSTRDGTATGQLTAGGERATSQRYAAHEATLLLRLSVDAVRKRAERGCPTAACNDVDPSSRALWNAAFEGLRYLLARVV